MTDSPTMQTFFVTFGQKHPLRNGWVEVRALDYEAARKEVFDTFGQHFSFIRFTGGMEMDKTYFPAGRFGEIIYC